MDQIKIPFILMFQNIVYNEVNKFQIDGTNGLLKVGLFIIGKIGIGFLP